MTSLKDLPKEDEFYGINFIQSETTKNEETGVIETKTREVKVGTYSLMGWWKGILGNEDTIDISEDSESATLTYTVTLSELDEDVAEVVSREAPIFIEVTEQYYPDCPLIVFYCYPGGLSGLSDEETENMTTYIGEVNLNDMIFGNFEMNIDEDGSGTVRYKSSLCLKGISVGKSDAIASFVAMSDSQLQKGLGELARMMSA
jgi:hypothetical protein